MSKEKKIHIVKSVIKHGFAALRWIFLDISIFYG